MTQLNGFKFVATLLLVLRKIESDGKTKYDTFYSHSRTETIINESDIDDVFESIYNTIISNIQKYLGKDSDWITESVMVYNINISRYNPLVGSSNYKKLSKELDHPRKGLINAQNIDDNECFKWILVRYLHLSDHNTRRIIKADKDLSKKLNFQDIKFQVKVREIHKIERKNSIGISVFDYENKEKHPIYVSRKLCEYLLCEFIINSIKMQKALCSYQRFQNIHV